MEKHLIMKASIEDFRISFYKGHIEFEAIITDENGDIVTGGMTGTKLPLSADFANDDKVKIGEAAIAVCSVIFGNEFELSL